MTLNAFLRISFLPVSGNAGNVFAFSHGTEAVNRLGVMAGKLLESIPKQFCNLPSSDEFENALSFYAHRELLVFLRVFPLPFHLLALLACGSLALPQKTAEF